MTAAIGINFSNGFSWVEQWEGPMTVLLVTCQNANLLQNEAPICIVLRTGYNLVSLIWPGYDAVSNDQNSFLPLLVICLACFFSICTCKIPLFFLLLFEISDWSMGHSCTISHQMRKQFNQEWRLCLSTSLNFLISFLLLPNRTHLALYLLPSLGPEWLSDFSHFFFRIPTCWHKS